MGAESNCRLTEIGAANRNALGAVLTRLSEAEDRFHEPTIPHTPLGRSRVFKIGQLYWPVSGGNPASLIPHLLSDAPWPGNISAPYRTPISYDEAVAPILAWVGNQPRRIWRVIRQINAVIAWCEKRAEGRKRAAEEILRQQKPWVDKIASEVLVKELASGTKTEKLTPASGSFRRGLR